VTAVGPELAPLARSGPLTGVYDVALLDLDGVLYRGLEPVEHAADALRAARAAGLRLGFVTNNAARPASAVAEALRQLGIEAQSDDVVTSAQAAAHLLAQRFAPGAPVLVVGGEGLRQACTEQGLRVVATAADGPIAVAQGYAPDVGWRELAEATVAVREGSWWVATNLDATLPSERGELPGNGSLVAVVATAVGRGPDVVAGKPAAPLFAEAIERTAARRPLIVGDRLDTDIAGARARGLASLLVLTGVATARDLLVAPAAQRPTYVAADLRGLIEEHPEVGEGTCGGWSARVVDGELRLAGEGTDADALRALASASWAAADRQAGAPTATRTAAPTGAPTVLDRAGAGQPGPRISGPREVLARLGL